MAASLVFCASTMESHWQCQVLVPHVVLAVLRHHGLSLVWQGEVLGGVCPIPLGWPGSGPAVGTGDSALVHAQHWWDRGALLRALGCQKLWLHGITVAVRMAALQHLFLCFSVGFFNLSCSLCSAVCMIMQNHLFPLVFDLLSQLNIKWSWRNVRWRLFSLVPVSAVMVKIVL